jgi:hypothetical protein
VVTTQDAGVRRTAMSSRVEDGVKLARAPEEGRELLGILPESRFGLQKLGTLRVILEGLCRARIQWSVAAFWGSDSEFDMRRENIVWMGKFRLRIIRMARTGDRRNKCVLTKYQPVLLPVEPSWPWDERTTRTFFGAILIDIGIISLFRLYSWILYPELASIECLRKFWESWRWLAVPPRNIYQSVKLVTIDDAMPHFHPSNTEYSAGKTSLFLCLSYLKQQTLLQGLAEM